MLRPAYELLREGAGYADAQTRAGFSLVRDSAGSLRVCALGAIAIAAKGDPSRARESDSYRVDSRTWYLDLLRVPRAASRPCPGRGRWPWQGRHWTCDRVTRLGNQVAHLNDRHGWSFDQIADWLEREHPDWIVPVVLGSGDLLPVLEDALRAVEGREQERELVASR